MTARRVLLRVIVVALCLTAAAAIVALLAGGFGETQLRIILTTTAIAVYGLLGLPAGLLLERGGPRWLGWLDAALAALGFLLALNLIWIQWDEAGDWSWKSLIVVTAAAGATAQTAAGIVRRRPTDTRVIDRLVIAAMVAAVLLAALVSAAALWEIDDSGYYRFVGAVAVVDVLLLVLVPVLRRGTPAAEPAGDRGRRIRVTFDDGTTRELDGVVSVERL